MECLRKLDGGENVVSEYERYNNQVGPGGLWQNHIEGAMGEFAVAKFLGLYPGGITDKDATDVGEHYEVRTRPKSYYELFVRKCEKEDKEDKYFILAQGSYGVYTIRGWITAYEVFDHPEWFHNHSGKLSYQYWVPHKNLYSIETLPKEAPCPKITSSQNLLTSTKIIQWDLLETS